jgi:predicted GNAT family N-acyltransferase
LADLVAEKTKAEVLQMARLLVSKKDHEIFGKTEFELRDRCHHLGAELLETALDQRKKRATKGRA